MCTAEVSTELSSARAVHGGRYAELIGFFDVENALSSGLIFQAEILARDRIATNTDESVFWAWSCVALGRSMCFQGRLDEAGLAIADVLGSKSKGNWPLVVRIAQGVEAFINGHLGRRKKVGAYTAMLWETLPSPRSYLETSAFVLAAFGEAACGNVDVAAASLLHGGGGIYLPCLQVVDRAYGYEILVENELLRGDIRAARTWISFAEVLPIDGHDLAAAAIGRARARVSLAGEEHDVSARESADSGLRASAVGGTLDAIRSQILEASAQAAAGDRALGVAALEEAAQLAADSGSATIRSWAVRELRRLGRRLRNVPGDGWDSLSVHQQLIARMAARGMRNKEIAAGLYLSEKTVESHLAVILNALGSPSRVGIGLSLPAEPRLNPVTLNLTGRQRQVAGLICEGLSNNQIAGVLSISVKTVEKHIASLFVRLGVRSRSAIAARLREGAATTMEP